MTTVAPAQSGTTEPTGATRPVRLPVIRRGVGSTDDARSASPEAPAAQARRLAAALARWYAEALAGRRDARALRDLLTPAVLQRVRCAVLREAARRLAGGTGQAAVVHVRSVHVQQHGDRFEAVVVVDDGTRATAIAATLCRRGAMWRVTDLARPEDRLPALASPHLPPD